MKIVSSIFFVRDSLSELNIKTYFICCTIGEKFFLSSILILRKRETRSMTPEAHETTFSKLLKPSDGNKAVVRTSRDALDRSVVDGFAGRSNLLFERKSTPLLRPSRPSAPRSAAERGEENKTAMGIAFHEVVNRQRRGGSP